MLRSSLTRPLGVRSLLLLTLTGVLISAGAANAYHIQERSYVFRNLAFGEKHYLHYFAVDTKTGVMKLDAKASQNQSGGFWEVVRAWDNYRDGYTTYYIRNRSNSPYNGYYLNIHPTSGNLVLTKTPTSKDYTAYWMIRYAKHQHGRAHHTIQSLGHSGQDMHFLSVNPETGEVSLSDRLTSNGLWTMNGIWIPPSERLR